MPQTLTIRVDPGVHKAVHHIAKAFRWSDSDVASTLLWMSLLQIDQSLIPEDVHSEMLADLVRILGNWGALSVIDPEKAKDDARKTLALLARMNKQKGR